MQIYNLVKTVCFSSFNNISPVCWQKKKPATLKKINLPQDIIFTEILPKLPVKSLLRFSCVCKSWRTWIKDPFIGDLHLNHSRNKRDDSAVFLRGLCSRSFGEEYLLLTHSSPDHGRQGADSLRVVSPSPDLPIGANLHLFGSCNGLLCLAGVSNRLKLVCLCNPITQECLRLPINLGLSTALPLHQYFVEAFGFGFDVSTKDYKVIRAIQLMIDSKPVLKYADIYKLSADCWSEVEVDLTFNYWIRDSGVFLNGSSHWCSQDLILTFDFQTEVFGKLECPAAEVLIPSSSYNRETLTVLDDSLAFITTQGKVFDIWVMMEYGNKESWAKRYSLGPSRLFRSVLTCWNDDKIVIECNSHRQLISYCSVENGSAEALDICGFSLEATTFRQTLVSLRKSHSV